MAGNSMANLSSVDTALLTLWVLALLPQPLLLLLLQQIADWPLVIYSPTTCNPTASACPSATALGAAEAAGSVDPALE